MYNEYELTVPWKSNFLVISYKYWLLCCWLLSKQLLIRYLLDRYYIIFKILFPFISFLSRHYKIILPLLYLVNRPFVFYILINQEICILSFTLDQYRKKKWRRRDYQLLSQMNCENNFFWARFYRAPFFLWLLSQLACCTNIYS